MFEPGQKVIVTESNVKRKTGPRVGSTGFVSDFNIYHHGIWFNKIVWHQYGNQEKRRMETSTFAMIYDRNQKFNLRVHGLARSGGWLEPIRYKKAVEDMDNLEFMCWLYSIMRTMRGSRKASECRRIARFGPKYSPFYYKDRIYTPEERFALALTARTIKNIYFNADIHFIKNELNLCRDRVDYLLSRGWSDSRIVRSVITKKEQWHDNFSSLFARMEFTSVSGKVAQRYLEAGGRHDGTLRRMRAEWQKQNGITS
jgi:hypothetical protein